MSRYCSLMVLLLCFVSIGVSAQYSASDSVSMKDAVDSVLNSSSSAKAPGLPFQIPSDIKYILMTFGVGGIAGWAVGFTMKKVAKIMALIVGVAFISIQALAYHRYIIVDWDKIKTSVPNEQLEESASTIMSMITYNIPFAGAFVVGLWAGFRKG